MFRIKPIIAAMLIATGFFAQTPDEAVSFLANENGVGTRALALGNAFTAVADDYTAVYWNPAGLALLNQSEITGELSHFSFSNEASFSGVTQKDKQRSTKLKTLGLAYKFPTSQGSFVLGFGYHRFKDFNGFLRFGGFNTQSSGLAFELEDAQGDIRFYPFDSDVLQTEEISETGTLNALAFGAGLAMSPSFNLGASVQFLSGHSQYLFDFYQDDIDDMYATYPANFYSYELHQDIHSKLSGVGLKLGGLFHVNREFRLGFSIDLPTSLHILETWSERDALLFDDEYISEMDLGPNEWEYVIQYPVQISGGLALDFRQLLLTASCSYRDWTQVQFEVPDGFDVTSDYSDLLAQNYRFAEEFRPVLSWGAGAELRVPGSGLKLRGGYRVMPSPLFNADHSLDKRYFSAGAGFDLDAVSSLQVTFIRGIWSQDTVDGYTPGGTHEKIVTDRVLAGLTLRLN